MDLIQQNERPSNSIKIAFYHLNALRHPTASASSDVQNHRLMPLSILIFA